MRYIFLVLTTIAILFACKTGTRNNSLFKTGNLETIQYTITIDRDTTIETKNGALLKIPKGTLSTDNGNTVTLEIKEAFTLEQMIQAGLTTQSNGDPLSSGGMIYINAAAGQNVTINQKIQVAIPTNFIQDGMQLFKGQEEKDGKINWVEPAPLQPNQQQNAITKAQTVFESRCGNCHGIGKQLSGPDLAHFPKRMPYTEGTSRYWYHYFQPVYYPYTIREGSFTRDYFKDEAWYDPYACNLIRLFNGPSNISLASDSSHGEDIFEIYRYIQNESDKRNLPLPPHAWLDSCVDSCNVYEKRISFLKDRKEALRTKRDELLKDSSKMVVTGDAANQPATPPGPAGPPQAPVYEERISPNNYNSLYYQFTIEAFGWYNIDILLKDVNGDTGSELFVRLTGEYRERIKIYLVIPSQKVYVEGGPAEDPEKFAFIYKNGKLSLPRGATAYIFGVTEVNESIAFGIKKFTTSEKQEIELELKTSTKEEFTQSMKVLWDDGLSIKAQETKTGTEIKKTNADLNTIDQEIRDAEMLKPKRCDCDCNYPILAKADTTAAVEYYIGPESASK